MHKRRYVFGILVACAVAVSGLAASAAQAPRLTSSAQSPSQPGMLTGCLEYGPRDSYVLATMNVPAQPALSDEPALERQELAAAEHSYQLRPAAAGVQLSQLVGAKVRVSGTVVTPAAPAAAPSAGRGQPSAPPAQLNASSVEKLADHCDVRPTMFAL
jgi:hypothetical protein